MLTYHHAYAVLLPSLAFLHGLVYNQVHERVKSPEKPSHGTPSIQLHCKVQHTFI